MIFYEEKIKTLEKNYNNFPFKKDRNRQFLAIFWAIVNAHFNYKVGFTLAKGDAYFLHDYYALVKMQEGAMQGSQNRHFSGINLGPNLCGVIYEWSLNIS